MASGLVTLEEQSVVVICVHSGVTPARMPAISSFWIASASCEGREASDPLLVLSIPAPTHPGMSCLGRVHLHWHALVQAARE